MNRREAKRIVCGKVAIDLWERTEFNEFYGLEIDLDQPDYLRVRGAMEELAHELAGRAGLPKGPPPQVDGQMSMEEVFGEDLFVRGRRTETVHTSVL